MSASKKYVKVYPINANWMWDKDINCPPHLTNPTNRLYYYMTKTNETMSFKTAESFRSPNPFTGEHMSFTYPKNFLPFHTLYHYNVIDEGDRLWQEINPIVVRVGDINELHLALDKVCGEDKASQEYRKAIQTSIEKRTYEVEYMIEQFMYISFLYDYHLEGE